MSKKLIVVLSLVIIFVIIVSGCAKADRAPAPMPNKSSA